MAISAAAAEVSLLRHKSFRFYWFTRVLGTVGYQMLNVAIGWQVYNLTNSALDLGFIGLVLFIPVVFGTFIIGHVADHYDRRAVVRTCQLGKALGTAVLIVATLGGWVTVELIFAVLFVVGTCRAFEGPTLHTIVPSIMPAEVLSRAIAAGATAQQVAVIGGPALGGFLLNVDTISFGGATYALGPNTVYLISFAFFIIAAILISLVRMERPPKEKKKITLETVLAGFNYIRTRPIIFGAISLDLGAVLLGGVTALLPVFARDILHAGPSGFGLLRSSPAVGALLMSGFLTRMSINRRAGHIMIGAVVVYGLSIAAFGLSKWLPISMIALAVSGAADAVSVVVRHSLVQTRTPNEMLGRVMAVNSTFTGTTSNLGQFESGAVAALLGSVPSVLIGGFGAVLVALLWIRLFPEFWRVQSVIPEK
jgi:MFS family permease